jgi:hypothetical protein
MTRTLGIGSGALCALVACGARTGVDLGEPAAYGDDAALESGVDAGPEVGLDAGVDARLDAHADVAETGPETSTGGCGSGCPIGFVCEGGQRCVASVLAVSPTDLLGVLFPPVDVTTIAATPTSLTDIARRPNGKVYGVSFTELYAVDPATGATTLLAELGGAQLNALDAAPDGTLYAAGGSTLYTLDPSTGALTTFATYPDAFASSGDLAVLRGTTLYATVTGNGTTTADSLLAIDLGTKVVTVVGSTGFDCVYGLAALGDALFGFTCNGDVLQIDPKTAAATVMGTSGATFYGACP